MKRFSLVHTPNAPGTIARLSLFATAVVPIVVAPGFFFPYITMRAVYFRALVEVASGILLYLLVRRETTLHFRRDAVFWSLVAWVSANALAAAFGVAPMRSIFGDHERMGGVWFWVHLLSFYVVLRTFVRPDDWWPLFRIAVAVASSISAYGLIQYWFRPFHFGIGGIDAGVTIGNSGLLAIYILANVALAALLAIRAKPRARVGYLAIVLFLVVALVSSGNRSSTLALLIGSGVAVLSYTAWSGSLRGWRAVSVVTLFASAGTLPFVTRMPWAAPVTSRIPALHRLSSGVDSSRVIQWRAAVDGIRARPLLGVGPENYQIIWSRYYHPEMYRFIADSRWDRAHNAYLDAFATAGILGFLSLLAIWLALGWVTVQAARKSRATSTGSTTEDRNGAIEAIVLGFFVAYASYLFFWFFDLNSAMLWIALAAFVASRATGTPLIEIGPTKEKRWQSSMVLGLGAVALVAVLYVHGFETLRMARTLDHARNPNQPLHETLEDFESVFGSPAPVTQHAFLIYAGRLRGLYPRFSEIRSDPARADLFDRAFLLAIKEFERQALQDPQNERVLVQHARVLMLGAYYYGNARLYESALAKLRHSVELAPRRVTTHLALGVAYLNAARPNEALEVFQRAYAVYPPLGQTHSYLAAAHAKLGDYDAAGFWLRSALARGYTPEYGLVRQAVDGLAAAGNPGAAAELALDYLRSGIGSPFLWTARGVVARPNGTDVELAELAVRLFSAAGDSVRAGVMRASAPGLCVRPGSLESLSSSMVRPGRRKEPADCREPWRSTESY